MKEKYRDRKPRGREIYEISIEIDSWKEIKRKCQREIDRQTDRQKVGSVEKRDWEINEKETEARQNKISTKIERKGEGVREREWTRENKRKNKWKRKRNFMKLIWLGKRKILVWWLLLYNKLVN